MEIRDVLQALEEEALASGVPILRESEREALLTACASAAPKRILEIGTAVGFSALLMAERCPGAEIDTVELDPDRHAPAASGAIWGTRRTSFRRSPAPMIFCIWTGRRVSTCAISIWRSRCSRPGR